MEPIIQPLTNIVERVSDATIGIIADMYTRDNFISIFEKESRYMYVALLVIVLLILWDILAEFGL